MYDFGAAPPDDILIEREVESAIASGHLLPRWGWAVPQSYNGSTGHERIAGWQKVRIAEHLGLLRRGQFCSVCHIAKVEHWHHEIYARPMTAMSVCRSCHFHVHRRFVDPDRWHAFLSERARAGDWTLSLRTVELDRHEASRIAASPDIFAALAAG